MVVVVFVAEGGGGDEYGGGGRGGRLGWGEVGCAVEVTFDGLTL